MAYFEHEGCTLHYEEYGQGEPLVLLHGLGSSCQDWEYQVPELARQYRVILLDVRGHGRSDKPRERYSIAGFSADLYADAGLLAAYAIAGSGQSLRKLEAALLDQLNRLANGKVGFDEMDKVRTQLLTSALLRRQTPQGLAQDIGMAMLQTGDARAGQARGTGLDGQALHGIDRALPATATDQGFRQHDRHTHQGDAEQVHDDERTAAVDPGHVGELPDIAEAYGRTGSRQNEHPATGPGTMNRNVVARHCGQDPILREKRSRIVGDSRHGLKFGSAKRPWRRRGRLPIMRALWLSKRNIPKAPSR